MSEATTASSGTLSLLDGRMVHPACAKCTHVHRVTETYTSKGVAKECTYDQQCSECGCVASDAEYDAGFAIGSDDDFRTFVTGAHLRALTGHSDASTASRVVPGGRLRRGWMGGIKRGRLPRLVGDQRDELVRQRRNLGRLGGRPDHGGTAHPEHPAGSARVRSVVRCDCSPGEGCHRTGGECA